MSSFDFDFDDVLSELDGLARDVPEAIPKAISAMSNVLIKRLREEAPERTGDLKKAIDKTGTRTTKAGNKYQLVFIKDRGKNDRNVHKVLALEYGTDKQPATPFWRDTAISASEEMREAAREVLEKAMKKK